MLHLILSISNQNHPFYHSGCDGSLNIRCLQSSAFSGIATSGGLGLISRISGRKKNLDVLTEVNIVSPDFATLSRAPWRKTVFVILQSPWFGSVNLILVIQPGKLNSGKLICIMGLGFSDFNTLYSITIMDTYWNWFSCGTSDQLPKKTFQFCFLV